MASASATTATMAAAGFDKRAGASSSSLQTPGSGVFPSELMSPIAANSPGFLKRDELRTPITPPSAYLDFLKNLSPAILSPAPTSAGTRFTFGEKLPEKTSPSCEPADIDRRSLASPPTLIPTSQPTSQPALSRNTSYDSAASSNTSFSSSSIDSTRSAASQSVRSVSSNSRKRPESPRVIIPPSPFAKPSGGPLSSARTPRRLNIPASPFSQQQQQQQQAPPCSAQSVPSPYSTTPATSNTPWSATFSSSRDNEGGVEPMSKPGKVSVRQVVTRTVTYCRSTPLDPAPKGKRRKIEVETAAAAAVGPAAGAEKKPAAIVPEDAVVAPVVKVEAEEEEKRVRDMGCVDATMTGAVADDIVVDNGVGDGVEAAAAA